MDKAGPYGPFDLSGRRALVTGGGSGLGFAIARGMALAGAQVIINGRNVDKANAAQRVLRDEALDVTCALFDVTDGAMVDFGDSRHLAYAVRLNGERLQYSGGTNGEAFALTTNEPNHLAGKLHIDDTAADGAKVDVTFDLTLVNTFASVR